jgi:hypothetical protein
MQCHEVVWVLHVPLSAFLRAHSPEGGQPEAETAKLIENVPSDGYRPARNKNAAES